MTTTRIRWRALAAVSAVILAAGAGTVGWSLRPARLRAAAISALSTHLGLDVSIDDLSVSFLPPSVSGHRLVLRIPNRPDLPPFVSVETYHLDVGAWSALRGHFRSARLDGLKINIPPGKDKQQLAARAGRGHWLSPGTIDRVDAPDAELTVLRRKPSDVPLFFRIHELTLTDAGFDRPMAFHTKLTNPVPKGLVDSTGRVGPFPPGDPGALPITGNYTLSNGDLSTIDGIAGTLSSTGQYTGVISRLNVTGQSQTPNFSLDLGGTPLPLDATFEAIVDGTDGTTELTRVDARLRKTHIEVSGRIDNLPGPGNHDIKLTAKIASGRMEDLMRLVIDSAEPSLSGDVALEAAIALPPGPSRAQQRLHVTGHFALAAAHFNQPQVQAKLAELSRRSQGKESNAAPVDVFANFSGQFSLDRGMLSLAKVNFEIPGAAVGLHGQYDTTTGALDLEGELRMQAAMSQVVGGWKGAVVKPFDFVFRRDGAGAVVPISVHGTRESPDLSVRLGALLKRGGRRP